MKITSAKFSKSTKELRPAHTGTASPFRKGNAALCRRKDSGGKTAGALPLRYKIFLANFLIALLSLVLYGGYVYVQTIHQNKNQIIETVWHKMAQVSDEIDTIAARVETQTSSFILSETFKESTQNMMEKRPVEHYESYLKLDRLCVSTENVDKLYTIRMYFRELYTMFNNHERFFYDDLDLDMKLGGASRAWFYDRDNFGDSIVYARKANAGTADEVAVLFLLPQRVFLSLGDELQFSEEEISFIGLAGSEETAASESGPAGLSPGAQTVVGGTAGVKSEILEKVIQAGDTSGKLNIRVDGIEYYVLFQKGERNPFYAISAYPIANMEKRAAKSVWGMFYVLIPILLAAFLLSWVVSVKISQRLKHLAGAMEHMAEHEFRMRIDDQSKDEIGHLAESFNYMSERITRAMEEQKRAEEERTMAELRLLQAQINPHFIYNTLDSVSWLAVRTDAPEISYIVRNLSDFLRMSLNMGNQETTVMMEIRHSCAYFNIQKFRFENRIQLFVDIPEEMNEVEINTLTLQPLVENAIIHGILSEEGRTGVITICGEIIDDNAVIYVNDDGIGMTEETVLNVQSRMEGGTSANQEAPKHGYGLYNIHQRLQHQFGKGYGVNIVSTEGAGTSCIVIVPVEKEQQPR